MAVSKHDLEQKNPDEKKTNRPIAIIKYNNGNGALLCNECRIIIDYGFNHDEDHEHFCEGCKCTKGGKNTI